MVEQLERSTPAPVPKRRRVVTRLLALGVLILGLVGALPSLLSLPAIWSVLLGQVNGYLAPGRIELTGLSLAWVRPLEIHGLALIDPQGKRVLAARRVRLDRGLFDLLRKRPDHGTITVEGAEVDVERRADGSIDLLDALARVLESDEEEDSPSDANLAVKVVVLGGAVRLASPELAQPVEADSIEATLAIVPGRPLEVSATLGRGGERLELIGTYDHRAQPGAPADLEAKISGTAWPLAVRHAGVTARGRIEGTLEGRQERGLWSLLANAKVRGFEAFGPALAGDHARLDLAEVIGDVAQTGSGWTIRRLDVTSPVGTLTGRGTIPAASDSPTTLDGTIDLARLGALLPRTLRLRDGLTLDRGTAGLHAQLSTRDGTERLELSAKITDLAATDRGKPLVVRDPATLSAVVTRSRDNLTVESLVARAAGLDLNAQGDLDRGVTLTGTLDLTTLQAQLRDLIELGDLDVAGRGRLAADYRRAGETYQARFVIEFRGLTIAGLTETPIRREMVRLDGSAIGPRSAQGLPDDWQTARLSLKAGDLRADLTANQRSGAMAVRANASADLTSPTPGRAEVNASLIGQGRVWEIAELRAGIVPTDPQAAPATVAMAARGRVDLDKGDARLTPLPGSSGVALGLAPAGVAIQGLGRTDVPLNVDATLLGDLAAMDRLLAAWSGAVPSGWGGSWSSRVTVSRALSGPIAFDGRVEVANLATPTPQGHLAVAVKGGYHLDADRLDLAALDADSRFGRLLARGAVTAVSAEKRAHLSGTLEPRWDTIQTMLAESVEPRARLEASMRPFRLSGPLTGGTVTEILRGLDGEVGLDVAALEAFGMRVGPTPVVLRLGQGRAVFDPIQTRINDGPTVLLADLALDDPNALWLRLAEGSRIEKAAINDAVSSAVLAYVAPVLSQATQVSGRVSVAARRAALPVLGGGSTEIEGRIVFENVLFQPGPFATEVLTLAGQSVPRLELNQPVQLAVANGRVRQSGLAIPLARDLRVDLAGSVGFDQTVRMKATLPVTGRMLGRNEIAEQIVGGTKITVPIDGTLSRPSLDRRALQVALREAARSLVSRGIETGAGMLLDRLAPGSDRPRPGRAGAAAPNSTGRDALRILEGLGREVLDPRRP